MFSRAVKKTVDSANRLKRRAGLTLIEAAMVLTILALVIGGVMLYYSSANTGRQESSAVGQLAAIQQAVRSAYAGQSSYATLTASALATLLPSSMVQGTGTNVTLNSAYNAAITVAPTAAGNQFIVTFSGVPVTACSQMATTDLGRSTTDLTINSTDAGTPPLDPTTASTDCNAGITTAGATMAWTFF